jgi:hypothetical protein
MSGNIREFWDDDLSPQVTNENAEAGYKVFLDVLSFALHGVGDWVSAVHEEK